MMLLLLLMMLLLVVVGGDGVAVCAVAVATGSYDLCAFGH